jgi:predicted RNA-binding Zn ribbon-like protein
MTDDSTKLPGGLEVVRDFVNTFDVEEAFDEFDTPGRLASWCRDRRLLDADDELGEADRRRAIEVREGLRQLLRANAGEDYDERSLAILNRAARNSRLMVRFGPDGRPDLEPGAEGIERVIGSILAVVVTSVASGQWSRLKVCGEDTCQWAFFDRSKNRSRTWCSMAVCGNRAKTRTYRRRQGSPAST